MHKIVNRRNEVKAFRLERIALAIFKAAKYVGGNDFNIAQDLAYKVKEYLDEHYKDPVHLENIQDSVEKVLIENGCAKTAKAYILYREKRNEVREDKALEGAIINMYKNYIEDKDWQILENSNANKSYAGLNNYIREEFTKKYWLNEVYPADVVKAHEDGDIHIHDLGSYAAYCCGWDIMHIIMRGFGGEKNTIKSKPPKHLRTLLGQIVNSVFTTQGETAGAQAFGNIDTYCAPFIREDDLTYDEILYTVRSFIFNLNVPTRVGCQCPFSNLTFNIKVPENMKKLPVAIGGKFLDYTYEECQLEMDMFNMAFCQVMEEGDANGNVFSFPIPTINITKDFDWDSPVVEAWMKITCKYGIPYFANYINSDLSPDDALSMCCRLRLDLTELRKRGGGLFGSNPLTGSIGVVTINLPRLGYTSPDISSYFIKLEKLIHLASKALEIKRAEIEKMTEIGMYPFAQNMLESVKQKNNKYWSNHFSTVGLLGMHESLLNMKTVGIQHIDGKALAIYIMKKCRVIIKEIQIKTGVEYNLEATPAEGTAYRLAQKDIEKYGPENLCFAGSSPECGYYTNSTQIPVSEWDGNITSLLDHQDELQTLYTGGTVQHIYLGDRIDDIETCKDLIKQIFTKYKLPYISITPTFSICNDHGYIAGEYYQCPQCNQKTLVYSRVTGFLRPVQSFNKGKREEFEERVYANNLKLKR